MPVLSYRHHPAPVRSHQVLPGYASRDMSSPRETVAHMSRPITTKEQRAAGKVMSLMLDQLVTHVRVDALDASQLEWHGSAFDLHGPMGLCTCCHGGDTKRARKAVGRGDGQA